MNTPIVVDAHIFLSLAVPLPYSKRAEVLMGLWEKSIPKLYAPMQWEYDLIVGLRQACAGGYLPQDEASDALQLLLSLGVESVPPNPDLHARAFGWAVRMEDGLSNEAHYVALAESLNAEFWSADRRLVTWLRANGATWAHCLVGHDD